MLTYMEGTRTTTLMLAGCLRRKSRMGMLPRTRTRENSKPEKYNTLLEHIMDLYLDEKGTSNCKDCPHTIWAILQTASSVSAGVM